MDFAAELFLKAEVEPFERFLLSLPLSAFFNGVLYNAENVLFEAMEFKGLGAEKLRLTPVDFARLFMAPNESVVSTLLMREQLDGSPAGFHVRSVNKYIVKDEPTVVIAYLDDTGPGVRLDALHLARVLLSFRAPARLCSVGIGLMACTAYRHSFRRLSLFAGGNGPPCGSDEDGNLVGYSVWPKFGFDAPLIPADLNRAPHLKDCASVLDVIARDGTWWTQYGRGREMQFDLSPASRSWRVLLDYLYDVFAGALK